MKRFSQLTQTASEADLVAENFLAIDVPGVGGVTKKVPGNLVAPKSVQDGILANLSAISTGLQAVENKFVPEYVPMGTSADSYSVIATTSVRGVCAPFKANKFDRVFIKCQCQNAATMTVKLMDLNLVEIESVSVDVPASLDPISVEVKFSQVYDFVTSFYLEACLPKATDNTFLEGKTYNYSVCDNYTYHAYIYIKVSDSRFDSQFHTLNCTFMLDTGKYVMPDLVFGALPPGKKKVLTPVMNPPFIYTVVQDLKLLRNYGVNLYPDHCFNTQTLDNIKCEGIDYKFVRSDYGRVPQTNVSKVQAEDVKTSAVSIVFENDNATCEINTSQVSVKSSVQNNKKAFVLVIGDSQGMYGAQPKVLANCDGQAFWMHIKKFFDMDAADGATSEVVMLGSEHLQSWSGMAPVDYSYQYDGETRSIHAAAECIGAWSINHFLHKATEYTFGDDKYANENYAGASPINPFYDQSLVNTSNIFSIDKWLERFRTLDDDGNRLEWGDPNIGSLITTPERLASINVCRPTHFVCMLGRNTVIGPSSYGGQVEELIDAVQRDCPNCKIAMCLHPDMPGSYNPENYPEVECTHEEGCIYNSGRGNQFAIMQATYNQAKNRENEGVFIVPVWFVQPTMYSWKLANLSPVQTNENKRYAIVGDTFHPSSDGQISWAYQIYAWILHTFTIN